MRVLSVNVSLPRDVVWRGKTIRTGIYKEPAPGACRCGEPTSMVTGRLTCAFTAAPARPSCLRALSRNGSTGLEPATSGVTGLFKGRDG